MARLLLLDNDERIVELLSWFLGERGFDVDTAKTFEEARERIAAAPPDLLVSDVDLGHESALEQLPRLSADGVLPRTLVVSGFLDEAVEARLRAVPEVMDTLAKPFEFNDLEETVRRCLASDEPAAVYELPVLGASAPQSTAASAPEEVPAAEPIHQDEEDDDGWVEITPT